MESKGKGTKQQDPVGVRRYNSGDFARDLYGHLLRDFRTYSDVDLKFDDQLLKKADGIKAFRDRKEYDLGDVSVGRFKRVRQLESILKKFRFSTDAYSDLELSELSRKAFLDEQERLHRPMAIRATGFRVLQRARLIARRILGEFPGEEVIENVRFGKKSSIGCPLSEAYIDSKLSVLRAFTGTSETTAFFASQVLPGDHILQRILANHDFSDLKQQLDTRHLNLVEVPKTWKAYRLITPLTLLGLFYSYGVGRVVQQRLKDAGLNIQTLQDKHRRLIRDFSMPDDCSHATADLSSASDSITSELLNRILPRAWYNAVKKTFVRQLKIGDKTYSTVSVLPMGNGATFPIETLVFYCIIKAIGSLTHTKGVYSVYGDDLIYPSRLHKYVVAVFPQLHLKLNLDKTFVRYPFRESCGADFYRGQDVRPYYLKGEEENLTPVRFEAALYKVYNGLVLRWDPEEIKGTLSWILSLIVTVAGRVLRVPPSFPDFSGVRVDSPTEKPLGHDLLKYSPISIQFNFGSVWFQFDFLTETPKKRVVKTTEPYYWLSLQGLSDEETSDAYGFITKHTSLGEILGLHRPKTALMWKKTRKERVFYTNGRRVVEKRIKYHAVVASRMSSNVSTATTRTGSFSEWS